ncbi:MAG TPA: YggS family pyridoxal phosphate-dependent enzyme, partial [Solirubrobacteraceae bacterium]|nr:YggS family pyridoxal phosphate-dependent enzyme [Solirubrobacteraceae bacterium]
MVELISGLRAEDVRANLERVRAQLDEAAARAGRPAGSVEVLAAPKYVPAGEMPVLARAGVRVVGENRAQDLEAKVAAHGELFEWDFIGRL